MISLFIILCELAAIFYLAFELMTLKARNAKIATQKDEITKLYDAEISRQCKEMKLDRMRK